MCHGSADKGVRYVSNGIQVKSLSEPIIYSSDIIYNCL